MTSALPLWSSLARTVSVKALAGVWKPSKSSPPPV